MDEKTIARFWSHVEMDGPISEYCPELGPCWFWTASRNRKGYGMFYPVKNHGISAHRFSMIIGGTTFADGEQAAHRCNNPACVNPRHLYKATCRQNIRDAVRDGRRSHLTCDKHNRAKLTREQAVMSFELRRSGWSAKRIAERFGVCKATISHLLVGRNWKQLHAIHGATRTGE